MIEYKTVEEVQHVEIVSDVRCNLCGDSCRIVDQPASMAFATVTAKGCRGQTFPPDSERWEMHLCQHCLAWLVARLRIVPRRLECVPVLGDRHAESVPIRELRGAGPRITALWTGDPFALDPRTQQDYAEAMRRTALLIWHGRKP